MKFRPLERKHLDECTQIVAKNWNESYARLARFQMEQHLSTYAGRPNFYVMEEYRTVAGFCGWSWSVLENGIVDIPWIHVRADLHRGGYGSEMMYRMLEIVEPMSHTILLATTSPAFFEKFDFKTVVACHDVLTITARTKSL